MLVIFTAIMVSIDGFIGGLCYGIGGKVIRIRQLSLISAVVTVISATMMAFGHLLNSYITDNLSRYLSIVLLLILGILALKTQPNQKEQLSPAAGNILIFAFAVAADAAGAALLFALNGYGIVAVPCAFGVAHFVLIGAGNRVSELKIVLGFAGKVKYLSAGMFFCVAFIKVFLG